MSLDVGNHVKCVLQNGAVVEGIIEIWEENRVQLKSLDGKSILIISHPSRDIMLIKIILEEEDYQLPPEQWDIDERTSAQKVADKIRAKASVQKTELEEKFDEAVEVHDPNNPDDRQSLAELRVELAKQERQIIAEKLREHRPSPYKPGTTPYHYPPVIMKDKSAYQPGRIPNGRDSKKPSPK